MPPHENTHSSVQTPRSQDLVASSSTVFHVAPSKIIPINLGGNF